MGFCYKSFKLNNEDKDNIFNFKDVRVFPCKVSVP